MDKIKANGFYELSANEMNSIDGGMIYWPVLVSRYIARFICGKLLK